MAIKINNNTVTGHVYYNGNKVQIVYINGELVWKSPIINSLITAEAIQYYYSPPVPVTKTYTLRVESQYYVEDWTVSAYFDLSSTLTSVGVTLQNTKSKTVTETGKEATKCEWAGITQPPSAITGYYYVQGPTTFRVIDNR